MTAETIPTFNLALNMLQCHGGGGGSRALSNFPEFSTLPLLVEPTEAGVLL